MEIAWLVFEGIINIIYGVLFIEFIIKYFAFKKHIKHKLIYTILMMILMFLTITVSNIIIVYDGIWSFVYVIKIFIFAIIFLQGSIGEKLFISILEYGIFVIISSVIVLFISLIFSINTIDIMYMDISLQRLITVFTVLNIYFIVTRLILSIKRKFDDINIKQWILFILIPLLSLILMVSIIKITLNNDIKKSYSMVFFLMSFSSIFILNIIIYFLISIVNKSNKIITNELLTKQSDYYKEQNIINLTDVYENIRIIHHDMKHHIDIINLELNKINNDEHVDNIKSYVAEINKNINNYRLYINTDNDIFDGVINYKIKYAKDRNIKINYIITHNMKNMDRIDICILFSNLLDNAIEACDKIENDRKYIELKIKKIKSYTQIIIKNPIKESVLKANSNFITTKSKKQLHGMGIKSINNIINKYNGMINYHEQNNEFNVEILLNI